MDTGIAVYPFGQGIGPLLLSYVDCTGIESSLLNCNHIDNPYYSYYYCSDAGVICPSCKLCIWVQIILTSELLSHVSYWILPCTTKIFLRENLKRENFITQKFPDLRYDCASVHTWWLCKRVLLSWINSNTGHSMHLTTCTSSHLALRLGWEKKLI